MKLPGGPASGDFSPANRFILTRLTSHLVQVNTPSNPETGSSKVLLSFIKGSARPWCIDLSILTEAELLAFRESVLIATEIAQPICAALDLRAREDHANGDDTDARGYRQVPTVLVRARALKQYDRRLLDGRENVLLGVKLDVVQPDGLPQPGRTMDELSQDQPSGTKDCP